MVEGLGFFPVQWKSWKMMSEAAVAGETYTLNRRDLQRGIEGVS